MMRYAAILFILVSCYYTVTYGISLWKDDHNKLGGVGAILLAMGGSIVPIAFTFMKM